MTFLRTSDSVQILARSWARWRGFFCALALIGAWCFSPSHVQASCGDYVIVVNPSAEYVRNRPIEPPMTEHPSCPCNGPQCRSSDRTPPMPAPAPIGPEYGLMLVTQGELGCNPIFGSADLRDWSILSEAHLLSPDPPPRKLS